MATGLSTYNYFMSSYAASVKANRYDAHKRNELRNVYNSIVKINKDNPVYLFKNSQEASSLAVQIKESARQLSNTMSSLSVSMDSESQDELLDKKVAYSSDTDTLEVAYIGDNNEGDASTSFQISVQKLATPQVNTGNAFYPNTDVFLSSGEYSFDVNINENSYELQFNINPGDTNQTLLERIQRMFNRSNIGISAELKPTASGQIYLELSSASTGEPSYGDKVFDIMENDSPNSSDVISYLGIDRISQLASNSQFMLNGVAKSSYSNSFTVNKNFDITLKAVSEDDMPITIGFKNEADSLGDNVHILANAFNNILSTAKGNENGLASPKLLKELGGISKSFKNEFEAIGINVDEDGSLSIEDGLLYQTMQDSDGVNELKDIMKDFETLLNKNVRKIMLNPMDYTDKTMVAYKNPTVPHYNAPYFSSSYSGMMFNSYC